MDGIFELGEKFVERQNQREEAAEKEEKGSVIGELKEKREEVAKAPKGCFPRLQIRRCRRCC